MAREKAQKQYLNVYKVIQRFLRDDGGVTSDG